MSAADLEAVRFGPLAGLLRGATRVAMALAFAGAVVPGRAGRAAGWALLVLLLVTPVLRVVWLAHRWARRGDTRFAAVAGVLLLAPATAAVIAFA